MADRATANSSTRTATGHKQDDQAAKTKPPTWGCLLAGSGFRAWGQREPALQGTSRLSSLTQCGLAAQGWVGHPNHLLPFELMLHRTPDSDVDAPCLVTREVSRNVASGSIASSLVETALHVVHQRIERDPGRSAVPVGDGRPFVEAANSC